MVKKENQRIALTKRLLQDGLLKLLESKSLDKISVTELCREAGINRATFYNHYASPQDLLNELEATLRTELENLISSPRNADEIPAQLELVCSYLKDHTYLITILVNCHADEDLMDIFSKLQEKYAYQHYRLKQAQPDPDTFHLVSTFLHTGCYHLIREWLVRDIQKTPKEISELILSIISKEYQ